MPETNVDVFLSNGMVDDAAKLSSDERDLINRLTDTEVKQLVQMWERLGCPDLPDGIHAMIY